MSRIRVLVVDDSAFARKVIREVLSRERDIEVVGHARDGLEGLEKITELRPDVVTLDLMMPDLDGLGVLRALPPNLDTKVVVVTASSADSEVALEALSRGAVEMVVKPTVHATDRLYQLAPEIVIKVRAAAAARARAAPRVQPAPAPIAAAHGTRLVVVGTSTGGPQALTELIAAMPEAFPVPLAMALHIPAGYTDALAVRLSHVGAMRVFEAREGLELSPGTAVLAQGGLHLQVRSARGGLFAHVGAEPLGMAHRPSVDVLFESAAREVGSGVLGVVLTGMGEDGLAGARAIRKAGGRVIAEAESSCIVYGMPKVVADAGLADEQVPLEDLARALARLV